MQYLKGTISIGLMFKVKANICTNQFIIILYSYSNSNYAEDVVN